jgi:nucleoside-diphosphate-sugar epimerase
VDDVIDAILLAAQENGANGKIYNLGAKDKINLVETARLMISIYKSGTLEFIPFPEDRKIIDIGDYWGDFQLIEKQLGWSPKIPLEEGLRKTLAYFVENIKHYR